MRTILWTQNESTDIKPTMLVDGSRCENEDLRKAAFDELCEAHDHLQLSPELRDKLWERLNKKYGFSHQANYAILKKNILIKNKSIYIQGCYLDEDVRGRKLPYMFLASGKISFEDAVASLREQSQILNRTLNEKEVETLQKLKRSNKNMRSLT